jgi:sec-independent protein translocase protein TatB
MPDIGWMELLVIGVVALIVVGPKDLPVMFRRLGQFTGRIRAMARDFQRAMDEAADETGMTELNRDLRNAAKYTRNPAKAGKDALKDAFGDIDLDKYPEGSATREAAEKRKATAEVNKAKAADIKARREAGDAPVEPAEVAPTPEAGEPETAASGTAEPVERTGTGGS